MNRYRHSTLVRASVALAVLMLTLGALSARPTAAQQGPDCEDPDTVACIPTSGTAQQVPPPTNAAGAAAAAAAPGPIPSPICPPFIEPPGPPPYPPPGPPLPAAAAAAPAPLPPYPCFNDLYATINRANLAYARAMRSLDSSLLRPYWGQDALRQLLGQIASLQASGSYRMLRLLSIQVVDQSMFPSQGYAWVHTSEHWTTATWSFDGYQYDGGDAWYDNYYYVYRVGGRWVIGTDIVQ